MRQSVWQLHPSNDFPETFQVVRTAVAVVDVIGVFPYVASQQWSVFSSQRSTCIGSRNQIQFTGRRFYQPCPTGAESTGRASIERFLEFLEAAPFWRRWPQPIRRQVCLGL